MGGITTTLFQRPRDPQFNNTTLLLSGNFPTNGANNNTFQDSSSNNFPITRNGGNPGMTQGTFSPFSQTGWSNFFGGTGNYATSTSSAIATTTTTFTIEGWIYPTATPVTTSNIPSVIADCTPASTQLFWGFGPLANGTLSFYWFDGSARSVTGNTTIALNVWTHIAISVNANAITLYVNGTQQTLTGTTTLTNRSGSTATPITFAQFSTGGSYFTGYISNFSVLSGTAKYSTSFTPSTTPLATGTTNQVLLFAAGNRFADFNTATTAKTFTITGTPSVQAFSPFVPSGAYTTTAVGGSGYFDGTGDYLTASSSTSFALGSGDYCAEAWVYITGTQTTGFGWGVFGTYPGSGTSGWSITINRSNSAHSVYWIVAGAATATAGTPYIPVNAWTHIAVTRSGTGTNNTKIFVNGEIVGQATNNTNDTASLTLYVGGQGTGQLFPGYISGTRFVKGSPVYTDTFTPSTAPPTNIANTSILLNYTNAGITDATAKNDLETVGNAQISTTQSKFGGSSIFFNGSVTALTTPALTPAYLFQSNSDWTIEFWFYTGTSTGTMGIFDTYFTNTSPFSGLIIQMINGTISVYDGSSNRATTTTYANSTWHHFAWVNSAGTSRIYINGSNVTIGGVTSWTTPSNIFRANAPIQIGRDYAPNYFTGYIDDLRITKAARYTANFNVPTIGFTDR